MNINRIKCKAVIFDLDGTLVDSNTCIEKVWRKWCSDNSVNFNELISVSHGRPTLETMRDFLLSAGQEMTDWFLKQELIESNNVKHIKGASEFISEIPNGCWAIATSGIFELASVRVLNSGLSISKIFITADKIKKGKPDPESFLMAAEQLGITPEEYVIFEDSKPGIKAALISGAKVIGVKTNLKDSEMPDAVFTINDFSELKLEILKSEAGDTIIIALAC